MKRDLTKSAKSQADQLSGLSRTLERDIRSFFFFHVRKERHRDGGTGVTAAGQRAMSKHAEEISRSHHDRDEIARFVQDTRIFQQPEESLEKIFNYTLVGLSRKIVSRS